MCRIKSRIRWYCEIFCVIEKPVLELKIKNSLLGRKESYPVNTFKNIDIISFNTAHINSLSFDITEDDRTLLYNIGYSSRRRHTRLKHPTVDKNM